MPRAQPQQERREKGSSSCRVSAWYEAVVLSVCVDVCRGTVSSIAGLTPQLSSAHLICLPHRSNLVNANCNPTTYHRSSILHLSRSFYFYSFRSVCRWIWLIPSTPTALSPFSHSHCAQQRPSNLLLTLNCCLLAVSSQLSYLCSLLYTLASSTPPHRTLLCLNCH